MRSPTLLLIVLLVFAAPSLHAKRHRHATPVPTPEALVAAPTPAPTPPVLFTVVLKDRQRAKLTLLSYDRFFVTAVNAPGTRFDIPWVEIAAVEPVDSNSDAELSLMRGNLTTDSVPVASVVEPRSPDEALFQALVWPGVILHGAGFRYAGDNDAFVSLAGAEFFGVLVGAFGAYLEAYPDGEDTSKGVPQDLLLGGAAVYVITWVIDAGFSPSAAAALDKQRGLALEPAGDGAQLAYHF
jgi:hypothetical protein